MLTHAVSQGPQLDRALAKLPSSLPSENIWLAGYELTPEQRWKWEQKGGKWIIGRSDVVAECLKTALEDYSAALTARTIIIQREGGRFLSNSGIALPRMPYKESLQPLHLHVLSPARALKLSRGC